MTWLLHVALILLLTAHGPDGLLVVACGLLVVRAVCTTLQLTNPIITDKKDD